MARIYTLRVEVALIHPPIWRGVEVPSITSLATLHLILQRLLGWDNSALYEFECAGERFGAIDYDTLGRDDPRAYDVRDVWLSRLLGESRRKMRYIYDPLGEAWEHELTLIAAGTPEDGVRYPRCVGGERSGPLRGIGGVIGYQELLRRWRDRRERPADALWPAHFDPEYFDPDEVWLESFEQLSALANASAGFHTIDLWSFATPVEQAEVSGAQLEFERQIAARRAPPARPAPPEFISVQELVSASERHLRSSADASAFAGDLLGFVEGIAKNLGKLSNLHTRQLAVDALYQIPGLIPEPPEP
ncbi:MAG: plasmid pRiA4b ORF-3 family protein, partial [Myxococcota bacterium]|nr:plasmid pRiA4b ORF-3 family protein [Myxococcota bacterium]